MKNIEKRYLLFLLGCIPSRIFLVYLAKTLPTNLLKIMGYICLIPAFSFMYIYLTNSRKTGLEVFGDKIWWNDLRPIHSFLYFLFSYNAILGWNKSWIILLFDVFLGLSSFLLHHFAKK